MTEPAFERDLPRLTSMRAFAALAVFVFHCGTVLDYRTAQHFAGIGYTGVAFFFVLSGFVLTWSARPDGSTAGFYRRRFARVYPLHLVTALVGFALYGGTAWAVVSNLLLIQAWDPRASVHYGLNIVSWSLSCEAFFYAMFPLLLVAARRWPLRRLVALSTAWLAGAGLITTVITLGSAGPHDGIYVDPAARAGEFLLGVTLAATLRRGKRSPVSIPVAVVFLLLSVQFVRVFIAQYYPATDFVLVPSFGLLIWAAASADQERRAGWLLRHPWLVYAGKVSFAFYLVHHIVLTQLGKHGLDGPVGVAAGLLITTALAVVAHHTVEVPAERKIRAGRQTQARLDLTNVFERN